jgi:hypothetical protein
MRVTYENIKTLPINDKEKGLLRAILLDVDDINKMNIKPPIYIDWQDFHNEYSPEWTDPCPDYYGCYTLKSEALEGEIIGIEMTIDMLDDALCTLSNYVINL